MPKSKNFIKDVEVFSAGTWNGDEYTVKDLDAMVSAFDDLKATMSPGLKLGHDNDQKLLQQDGLPSAGWVTNLYRKGKKLFADFSEMPEKIFELVKRGAYKKVSSEIFCGVEVDGKKYQYVLGGVALLGADMPAVVTLNDILANYTQENSAHKFFAKETDTPNLKTYTFEKEGSMPLENAEELKIAQAKIKELEAKITGSEKELGELKSYKADTDKRVADLESANLATKAEAVAARLEADVTLLVSERAISPAMKPYALALLGEDKKEYSLKAGDKDEKLSKLDLLKSMFKLHAEAIKLNTHERTVQGEKIPQGQEANDAIEKICKDQNVSYKEGYKIYSRQQAAAGKQI